MAIETSAAYKAAIKADVETTRFEGEFGFYPDGSIAGSNVPSGDEAVISRSAQVNDGTREMSAKWAEFGRWKLDGTFKVINPDDPTAQVGYWSPERSGDDGAFSAPLPYRDYVMDAAYDIIGVTVFFDDACGEYATSLTVQYYSTADALLDSETFANGSVAAGFEFPCMGVKWIRVIINAWSRPGVRAKICEILPGETFIFNPDNIFSFSLTEAFSPFSTSLELPSFTVNFDNTERKFDLVNAAGLMAYLRTMMRILTRIGLLVSPAFEYINTGEWYVYSWPDTPQEDAAQLVCKPAIALADNIAYVAPGAGTQTVAAAAAVIFGLAGITNYSIDASLQSITVNQYIGDNVPLINALGQLAVAAGGVWRFERDGSYSLVPFPVGSASVAVDYDNMWERPGIVQTKKITQINVKSYAYNAGNEKLDETSNIITAAINNGGAAADLCSCFIPTPDRAAAVGALALQYHAMRLSHDVSFRGDMSIEAGDVAEVENDYGACDVLITRQTITWDAENKLSGAFKGVSYAS